jgi:hypothetical protein
MAKVARQNRAIVATVDTPDRVALVVRRTWSVSQCKSERQ